MCGIAGIWNHPTVEAQRSLTAMLRAQRHRGPDGQGTLSYPGGAAGMVRLALVDLSERGQQPLWSIDRQVAIVFNGEMYNFREQRAKLAARGYPFHSACDTEVVLALYLERGEAFLEQVRGMFALAIFDWRGGPKERTPTLLLARDPFGIKPLYLAQSDGGLVFASELKALLASGLVAPTIDTHAVADFLALGFVVQPRTILRAVRQFDPGTLQVLRPDAPARQRRFWSMPAARPRTESLADAAARLRSELDESVRLHALADVPMGAYLSGGVDSTAVVSLMHAHVPRLRTFTLKFVDVPGRDEADEAAATAHRLGCDHTAVEVTGADVAAALPRFVRDLDQPSKDGLNTWLISRAAARDVKGVLSGVGGDEWFAGYNVVRRMVRGDRARSRALVRMAGNLAHQLVTWVPDGHWRRRVASFSGRRSPVATWLQSHGVFSAKAAARLAGARLPDAWQEHELVESLRANAPGSEPESVLDMACRLDTGVFMQSQLLRDSDATTMAHSLELRVPLVDTRIAELARSCSPEHKINANGRGVGTYDSSGAKRVLIEAVRDLLPADLGSRQKRGFVLPFEHWMARELRPALEEASHPRTVAARGLLDPTMVAKLHAGRDGGEPGLVYPRLWTLAVLELWCREVLDSRVSTASAAERARITEVAS
jgi:asparagine synthase (glutamine-hydrolysing)